MTNRQFSVSRFLMALFALLLLWGAMSCEKEDIVPSVEPEVPQDTVPLPVIEPDSIYVVSGDRAFISVGQPAEIRLRIHPDSLLSDSTGLILLDADGDSCTLCAIKSAHRTSEEYWNVKVGFTRYYNTDSAFVRFRIVRDSISYTSARVKIRKIAMSMSEFKVDGQKCSLDKNTRTFSLTVPLVTDFSGLKVSFKFTGDKITAHGRRLNAESDTLDMNNGPVTLRVWCDTLYTDYYVTVRNTGLPVVRINTPGGKSITSKTEWMEGASMKVMYANGELDFDGGISIRGRGNSTWNYVKKPYAIKLDEKSKILGMPKDKRWVLLANWKDRTILRNEAGLWLSAQSGLPYTVRGQYVEVVLNGKHIGNYYLCEQIKISPKRVNIEEMAPFETDPELIKGGYLMELDTYFDEPYRFRSKKFNLPYQFKTPDEDDISQAQYDYFVQYITDLETVLADTKRVQNHEYRDWIDVDKAIDFLLVEELTGNHDFYNTWPSTGPHSVYLYKDRGSNLLCMGPAWDFDYHTFVPDRTSMWAGAKNTIYYPALLKDPDFKARLIERWDAQKYKFKELTAHIDSMADYIRVSEEYNHKMWPINTNSENGDENMTFQKAVDRMKDAFVAKWNWMDVNIRKL